VHWRGRGTGITNLFWEQEQIAKNVTNQMTFIVRVIFRPGLKLSDAKKLSLMCKFIKIDDGMDLS
jgi:hypothetical protein